MIKTIIKEKFFNSVHHSNFYIQPQYLKYKLINLTTRQNKLKILQLHFSKFWKLLKRMQFIKTSISNFD